MSYFKKKIYLLGKAIYNRDMKKLLIILSLFLFSSFAHSWEVSGGLLDGKDWKSNSLDGKVYVLFYVSPGKKNLNNDASEALKKEKFDSEVFASVAAIDLKSSWLPNGLIRRAIKKKQKKYPRTIYLTDKEKSVPKQLNFEESGNDILVFDKEGVEVFRHLGKLGEEEIKKMISTIKSLN